MYTNNRIFLSVRVTLLKTCYFITRHCNCMSVVSLQQEYAARGRNVSAAGLDDCAASTAEKYGLTKDDILREVDHYLTTNNYVGVQPGAWSTYRRHTTRNQLVAEFHNDMGKFARLNDAITAPRTRDNLRVCTFNVHFWSDVDEQFNFDRILSVIKNTQADVVCLQEAVLPTTMDANIPTRSDSGGWMIQNIIGQFEKAGYMYNTSCATDHTGRSSRGSFFGNVIFSKFPIESAKAGILDSDEQNRCFVSVTISNVTIACVHLDVFDDSGKTRVRQIKGMLSKLEGVDNLIVCGDFNALYSSDYTSEEQEWLERNNQGNSVVYDECNLMAESGFVDAFAGQEMKYSVWSARRVDYQWIRGSHLNPVSSHVYYTTASDHLPLVVDYRVLHTGGDVRHVDPPPPVSSIRVDIDNKLSMRDAFDRLLWTHNTPYETLHKMIAGEYKREIRCCEDDGSPYKLGAQFRYGLDSQYGDIVFVAKAGDWWKSMKGVARNDFDANGAPPLVENPVLGHLFQEKDFLQYDQWNKERIDTSLRRDAQLFDFRPHDATGSGLECMRGEDSVFTWCNTQMHLGSSVPLDLIGTVLAPRWIVDDKAALSMVPNSGALVNMVTNNMPVFPDGTKNELDGKFVLYGPSIAENHYEYIRSAGAFRKMYGAADPDAAFNATYLPFISDFDGRRTSYGSTARSPALFGNSSRMAMSAAAFDEATQIYMNMLVDADYVADPEGAPEKVYLVYLVGENQPDAGPVVAAYGGYHATLFSEHVLRANYSLVDALKTFEMTDEPWRLPDGTISNVANYFSFKSNTVSRLMSHLVAPSGPWDPNKQSSALHIQFDQGDIVDDILKGDQRWFVQLVERIPRGTNPRMKKDYIYRWLPDQRVQLFTLMGE